MPSEQRPEAQCDVNTKQAEDREEIMQFFDFDHLAPRLRDVSAQFAILAHSLMNLPRCEERSVALRKLLEAKDAAVRARLW